MNRKIHLFILFFLGVNCAQANEASITLRTDEAGFLVELVNQQKVEVKKDFENSLKVSSPSLLKLEDRIPVLILPVTEGNSEVKLYPPKFKEAAGELGQKEISFLLSDLLMEIQRIQKEIQKKNLDQATVKLEELQRKYPNVAFLNFIKASVLLVKGKKSEARQAVKKALETHPDFQEGKDFLKSLGGETSGGSGNE